MGPRAGGVHVSLVPLLSAGGLQQALIHSARVAQKGLELGPRELESAWVIDIEFPVVQLGEADSMPLGDEYQSEFGL